MRVCLIDTTDLKSKRLHPSWCPLGLASIGASLLSGGHEVRVVERDVIYRKGGLQPSEVDKSTRREIERFRPELVGISSPTPLFADALCAARIVKQTCGDIPVVYGGPHATAAPRDVLGASPDIDVVIQGEGEGPMLQLAAGISPQHVAGASCRHGASTRSNLPGPRPDLDSLPPPARHLLDMTFHTSLTTEVIRYLPLRTATVLTSRGCPQGCSFCVESLTSGRKPRYASPARVLEELEAVLHYGVEAVYFLDEAFLSDRSRVVALCEALLQTQLNKRLRWAAQVRADSVDREILALMAEAGCIQLECGFETGSDRLLREIGKRTSRQQNLRTIQLLKEAGIRCLANLIVGLPGEREEDVQQTADFLQQCEADHIVFSRFALYPGSKLAGSLVQQGQAPDRFWLDPAFYQEPPNFTAMSTERLNAFENEIVREIVKPTNTHDRMSHITLRQRLAQSSWREWRRICLHSPLSIPRFLWKWTADRIAKRRRASNQRK